MLYPRKTMLMLFALLTVALTIGTATAQSPPVGLWNFDDPGDLTLADTGIDLVLTGVHQAVDGTEPGDGAALIDVGSHYTCDHGIPANGGGSLVNEYTLVMDIQTYGRGIWHCFLQTSPLNGNDGDAFISPYGHVGVGDTGYSTPRMLDARTWYRMAFVVDNGARYEIYADGTRILDGTPQAVDGRFSLDPTALLFADENSEDNEVHVSRIALYDQALSEAEVVALGSLGGLDHFFTRPYLQNVKTDGISIMWETEALESGTVEYGLDAGYGEIATATAVDSLNGTFIYTAVLTGLLPGTTYHYQAVSGTHDSGDRSFTTAPAGEADFSFAVWSDSQGYNGGDYPRDPTEPSKAMFDHMRTEGVDFAVTSGDLAEDGGNYEQSKVFFVDRPLTHLAGQGIPVFIAWGNHDGGSDAVIRKFTDLPSKDRGAPYHAGYGSYSFDHGGCHFICIDYLRDNSDIPGWLEQDLQTPAAQNARFIFLFIHRPPYCERWIDGVQYLRDNLVPLMETYGVDACFSGHMHGYNRGWLNGVHYCVTGGASWLEPDPLVHDWPHMTVGGYHDLAPDIDGGVVHEYVKVEKVGDTFTATMFAFDPDGSYREVLDSFTGTSSTGQTVSADLSCVPDSGTVPFSTLMTVNLANEYTGQTRRIAGHISISLANGTSYSSWRSGYSNVASGNSFSTAWSTTIPALGSVIGTNLFTLAVEDVTPAPYNQPPYPPSGDTDISECTVTGVAP